MPNSADVAGDQNALSMLRMALDSQSAKSRAGLAIGLSVAASIAALASAGVSVWMIASSHQSASAGQIGLPQAPQSAALAPRSMPAAPLPQSPANTPLPGVAGDAASEVFLAAGNDGQMYAHDAGFNTWFRFTPEGVPEPIDVTQVPEEARQEALRQAESGQSSATVNTQAANAAADAAQVAAQTGDDRRPLFNEILKNAESARAILTALERTAYIEVEGEKTGEQPVYAFYDPRCPYSHAAFKALDGKIQVRWLPTLALGEGGAPHTAYILGDMDVEKNEEGEIVAAIMREDDQRDDRLRRIMNEGEPENPGEMTEAQMFAVDENMGLMRRFYGPQTSLLGVPSFIVGRPDGTAAFIRGYDEQTPAMIEAVLRGED